MIDGAANATFSVFQVTNDEFSLIFPSPGQDMEIVEDFIGRLGKKAAGMILEPIWERPILKRDANGIHGTLFYDNNNRREHFPATKREVDWDRCNLNAAQQHLFSLNR